ncbi:MAG TPA: phosphotransferase [Chloroflexota bacterium]|nr:phosphotransferase [Chloroflexota bacterium]
MARATSDEPLGAERITARVTRVTLPDGRRAALKRAAPGAPVDREAAVLRFLHARGCAVPEVISASSDELVTEWCGEHTLDDALQAGLAVSGSGLSEAVRGVGRAMNPVAPAPASAHDALRAQLAPWLAALPAALRWLSGAGDERLLAAVIQRALECPPEAGSLDYTARNVLVGATGEQVWLIDFAATGFDWTERRLAQYALSAGSGRPAGVFRSALDATVCGALEDPAGVDAHEVILLLTASEHLRQVETGDAHEERSRAWANVAERRASLLTLLRRPLAESGPAAELRAALR